MFFFALSLQVTSTLSTLSSKHLKLEHTLGPTYRRAFKKEKKHDHIMANSILQQKKCSNESIVATFTIYFNNTFKQQRQQHLFLESVLRRA